ncbi:MAG TPA: hypothetical protein VHV10_13915, partial [Ktedonobacteraceae bacterium]|nr:hypothetical protein [Ktedonobacteraceae bacterium]
GVPGISDYVSIGSVSEDTPTDLSFWNQYAKGDTNKRIDIRYIYINGGPVNGWRTWSRLQNVDGYRAISYIQESKKRGIVPFFVYYNIPGSAEGYQVDKQHIEDAGYMASYFKDLKFFLDIVHREGGDDPVGIVLEPDFIAYMMQQSNGKQPTSLDQLPAQTNAVYSSGVLTSADGSFPDTIQGLIQAINSTIKKYAPNALFGWQFNLWASPGITVGVPSNGIMHLTDTMGIDAGRSAIANEAKQVASYYLKGGIATNGASFISFDKYGLDGAAIPGSAENPSSSVWFWNADHWNNYLLYVKTIHDATNLPAILWQIPVGHINSSLAKDPYLSQDGPFPDLDNTVAHYEDSAPTFFLGDTFNPGSPARFNYFTTNKGGDPKITSGNNNTIQWEKHMQEARDAGVISILFGAGVGASTHGIGSSPGTPPGSPPGDSYWWITQVQRYYSNPTPLILQKP